MSEDQEILRIGKQLEKLANSDTGNDEQALDLLRALQGVEMSLDMLQKSRVGLSVNKLRQKLSGSDVSSVAKKLIKSWKRLLPGTPGQSPAPLKPVRTPESVKNEAIDTPKSERPVNHSTPPPVAYNPSVSEQPMTSSQPKNSMANGALRRMSSTSDDFVLMFSGDISGISRTGSTGNEVRDRCRDLVAKALKKGFENVSIEDEIKFYNLSAKIEQHIFSEYRDTGMKYKSQVRSRVSNLGDLKNPTFRQAVINGHLPPSKVAVMKTDEIASEELKKLRKAITKEGIREAQVAQGGGTPTDLLKCGKCKKRNCTYTQAQTRSADEPMTTFAYCNDCGNRWKFC
ncbi:transcription elongation factor A protein 1-like [Halichondria panicea]|uniref:transcription elongation factor A protein 1-like n=1 Tax=Halichondria panicea TaxID=6063 RepID=UPI00312B7622